jgi:uncharacterized RDD family membrane protein YckC
MTKNIEPQYEYATLNRKIVAFGIDIVIITFALWPISNLLTMIFFGFNKGPLVEMNQELRQAQNADVATLTGYLWNVVGNAKYIMMQLIMLLFASAYFIYFWSKIGASIGKLIMRCKIVDADTYHNITVKQAIMRMLGHFLNVLTLGVGLFIADFTKRKQGLHDKLANTVVVIKKKQS